MTFLLGHLRTLDINRPLASSGGMKQKEKACTSHLFFCHLGALNVYLYQEGVSQSQFSINNKTTPTKKKKLL